jgi:hypothetical protein
MIALQDEAGRLVVILPMQSRRSPKMYNVYIDGTLVAEFGTCREALEHVSSLVPEGLAKATYCRL